MTTSESPLFARAYDLAQETMTTVERFPRSRRAVVGRRLEETALDFHAALVGAAKAKGAGDALARADAALDTYRFLLRLANDLKLVSDGRFGEIARLVAECGRLLGGWQKKLGGGTR